MNQPTEQTTEQNSLQSFLLKLAAVAEAGGDVVQAIRAGHVTPPDNVPHIIHGATGEKVWERGEHVG